MTIWVRVATADGESRDFDSLAAAEAWMDWRENHPVLGIMEDDHVATRNKSSTKATRTAALASVAGSQDDS